ncbi:FecR family protein [Chitinophaga costaii]|uniref:FecR family protein n=1 Tax=Chitinophaga costaii TaxID=1335309 RepID=A0A1C4AX87_9BACT|nr:FecR domain-containing protein [Chitinophaga costaii]PUZ26784.1 DUF4974 domain-containing protein [Chitinophaga costaii]SCB99189.1 FecR family protein [Chitinophaga costaii]
MASNKNATNQFLQLPAFRKWVLENDASAEAFWASWRQQHPEQEAELLEAAEVLRAIHAHSQVPDHAESETWARITDTIQEAELTGRFPARVVTMRSPGLSRRWLSYAAVVAGVAIAVMIGWQLLGVREKEYHTAMGELKTIELPDHSMVRLNVNSSVRYASRWRSSKAREVWVNGEAYFSVTHQENNQSFIVHTNDVDIRVVGTEFNVNTRRIKTQVVLNKGIVQLLLNGEAATHEAPITMKPGDMVTYSAATAELASKKVNPGDYSSWQSRVLHFNDTPIPEVIRVLQENIGITIESSDTGLINQTFTGSIPLDNVDVFFKTLSRSFDVKIAQTSTNTYRISSN